jgi:SNF2 family DNA or RNA helicase
VSRYLFKLDKELLDLNALEMDDMLVQFLNNRAELGEQVVFLNGDGLARTLKINLSEKLLQGRGIKGLFAPFATDYLCIESAPGGSLRLSLPAAWDERWMEQFAEKLSVQERARVVMQNTHAMKQDDEIWFQLYDVAQQFTAPSKNSELVCLPHLRELNIYEYQTKTVKAVLGRFKGRALLCDEVGLGKTVEAGICLLEYMMRGLVRKVLILVPPSLVGQWHEEMRRKFNQDFIRADDPAFSERGVDAWAHYPKVIASLSTAKRSHHSSTIAQLHYDLVIVDEAHHLKNRNTVAWKFVNNLKKKYILLLTATPVQNGLEELYNLITLLKPGQLKTYAYFKKNFVEDNAGIEVKNADKLKSLLAEVMIRNRRSNVDVKFTKRKAYTKIVTLSDAEWALYLQLSHFIRAHYEDKHPVFSRFLLKNMQEKIGSTFAALARSLQNLAEHDGLQLEEKRTILNFYHQSEEIARQEGMNSSKIQELFNILTHFQDKMLVFTKYRTSQAMISHRLREQGFRVAEFHGGLTRKEKEREIAFFKEQADVLVSTEVGGEGRNLQFCNGMVNFDLPWNPMAIEQRIGRLHRIGQLRDVFVYNLAAQHTVEHYMLHVLDRKINMFELVIGEVDMILGDMEENEEFSDQVMKAWVRSATPGMMEKEMDQIGEKLLENKQRLQKVKEFDARLFQESVSGERE